MSMSDTANTASDDGADKGAADYQHPNDLETELSAEEEQAFIDETLGLKGASKDDNTSDAESDQDSEADKGAADEDAGSGDDDAAADEDSASQDGDEDSADDSASDDSDSDQESKAKESEESSQDENGVKVDDLFIEVKNSEGKDVKLIFDPTNPNSFLPDDFTFKDDKQLFEILAAKQEMADLYKERSQDFETQTKEASEKASAEAATKAQNEGWDAEIENLVAAGLLDEPKVKPGDKGFMDDPAVQKIDNVFKWLGAHNTKLRSEGKAQITSFGTALSLMNKEVADKDAADKKKADNAEAKRRGALVGGTSAASGGDKKVYRAGSYSSIHDVPVEL